jgi:hypothetical protein
VHSRFFDFGCDELVNKKESPLPRYSAPVDLGIGKRGGMFGRRGRQAVDFPLVMFISRLAPSQFKKIFS